MFATLIFSIALFLMIYTYLLYPFIIQIGSINKDIEVPAFNNSFRVFVLIAAHNEESVIIDKLNSINANNYPSDKVKIYIGSDNSNDKTDVLVSDYLGQSKFPIDFTTLKNRSGKIGALNLLYSKIKSDTKLTENDIFISTDANVMFDTNTISKLVRHFQDPTIGIVDTHIQSELGDIKEIYKSETKYLSGEVKLKYKEGVLFGKLMGVFGGCFAIRSNCFCEIPKNLRVDDFYLTMKTLVQDYKAISDPEAICFEKVGTSIKEEFKRKRRISSGNFQNLSIFKGHALPFSQLGFVYFSHKVIRYLGPFLMIVIFLSSAYLALLGNPIMQLFLAGQLLWYIVIPAIDKIFQICGINVLALRHIRYFNYMNLAMLLGFKDYINGIDSNIWEPTKRR